MTLYRYVGPQRIADRVTPGTSGYPIRAPSDVRAWVEGTRQELSGGSVTATFVVDATGLLLVADRRSEHVACAGGHPVQSAGEITFALGESIEVAGVTNQSTGYCPEPRSWPSVDAALTRAGLVAPEGFTAAYHFRRCGSCGSITLVKDDVYECGVCGKNLPVEYNVQS